MELNEKLDKSYNKDKKAYEKITKLETIIKKLEKDLKTQTRTKEDAQIKKTDVSFCLSSTRGKTQ